ncbi:hypothetical protein [Delftia lacustris]
MPKPNMPRRFGRLPWQAKLRMKRQARVWDVQMAEWRAAEARLAATRAASAAWLAEQVAGQGVTSSAASDSQGCPITRTDLPNGDSVLNVGTQQLVLSMEELARLHALTATPRHPVTAESDRGTHQGS